MAFTAVPEIVRSAFLNQGEICLCSSRILVHRARMKEFTERFTEAARERAGQAFPDYAALHRAFPGAWMLNNGYSRTLADTVLADACDRIARACARLA